MTSLGYDTDLSLVYVEMAFHNLSVRQVMAVAFVVGLLSISAKAVRELVEIKEPQPAQRVEGIVLDPAGVPIPDMAVTDRTEYWGAVLRSTETDAKGHFHFSAQRGKTIYWLRFDHMEFNPLQLRLTLDKKAPQRGITARPQIGG